MSKGAQIQIRAKEPIGEEELDGLGLAERRLARYLLHNINKFCSRRQLSKYAFGSYGEGDKERLWVTMSRVRTKWVGKSKYKIITSRKVGYKLEARYA